MCGPQALPEGWTSHVDAEGRTYYSNSITGESTWTCPQSLLLPAGWSAHQDPEGRTYYSNALTGESTWIRPEPVVLPQGWNAHQDGQGRTFYANSVTGESSWTIPFVSVAPPPKENGSAPKEFGSGRVNKCAQEENFVDQGTPAARLEERLMCGGFFQQMNSFAGKHAHKFTDPSDGSGHSFESYSLFKEYENLISARCEHFLQTEELTAMEVVNSMLSEEELGKKFKSSEYLMAAIDFEMFVSLMLDFKTGEKDVSRWWEICEEEANNWYTWVPAE